MIPPTGAEQPRAPVAARLSLRLAGLVLALGSQTAAAQPAPTAAPPKPQPGAPAGPNTPAKSDAPAGAKAPADAPAPKAQPGPNAPADAPSARAQPGPKAPIDAPAPTAQPSPNAAADALAPTAQPDEAGAADPEQARLRAEAAELDRLAQTRAPREDLDLGASLVQMTLSMGAVALLAYLLLGKLLPRLMRVKPATEAGRLLTVVDRMPIDQRRSLMIVRMGERYLLLGVADQNIGLLSQLEPDEVQAALLNAPSPEAPWTRLGRLLRPEEGRDA